MTNQVAYIMDNRPRAVLDQMDLVMGVLWQLDIFQKKKSYALQKLEEQR